MLITPRRFTISSLLVLFSLLMLPGASEALRIYYVPGEFNTIQGVLNHKKMSPSSIPSVQDGNSSFDRGNWTGTGDSRTWQSNPYDTLEIRLGWDHGLPEKFVHEESGILFQPQL